MDPSLNTEYLFFSSRDPVVAIAAPSTTRELLNSTNWTGRTGELAVKVVELQLRTYYTNLKADKNSQDDPVESSQVITGPTRPLATLVEATVQKIGQILEDDPDSISAIASIINNPVFRSLWKWDTIPYSSFCAIKKQMDYVNLNSQPDREQKEKDVEEAQYERDQDHWILRNEEWLRDRRLEKDSKEAQRWISGLVSLSHCDNVFPDSVTTDRHRKISRPQKMDGFTCLDAKRSPCIYIQPDSTRFQKTFDTLTDWQLKGLDWSNIFVAGGIVLGSLLWVDSHEATQIPPMWKSSDIDLYIYGLDPVDANKKIRHLFQVFKQNLPESTHSSILVVKNSKTITFIPPYPRRRIQIILKLVKSPAEVLLNFDLDICAMGFDGKELWMLPRAARALETGYNVFTMDMVQGHYLGDRRASQEQRVFKYASRGYGIRFLPSYVDALKTFDMSSLLPEDPWSKDPPSRPVSMETIATKARTYFEKVFAKYKERASRWGEELSHSQIDTDYQLNSEPGRRSCLTGFELFFRHVALWEAEQAGRVTINEENWASTTYDTICGISYHELPNYPWNDTFSSTDFTCAISIFNDYQTEHLQNVVETRDLREVNGDHLAVARILAAETVDELLEAELFIPIWMPPNFVSFAKQLIESVSLDHPTFGIEDVLEVTGEPELEEAGEKFSLVRFHLSSVMVYQHIDRRIDELYEVIWSIMHANNGLMGEDAEYCKLFRRQLSNRALRRKSENEMKDFVAWVIRYPGGVAGYYGVIAEAVRESSDEE